MLRKLTTCDSTPQIVVGFCEYECLIAARVIRGIWSDSEAPGSRFLVMSREATTVPTVWMSARWLSEPLL